MLKRSTAAGSLGAGNQDSTGTYLTYTMRRKENERERERYFHYTFYLIFRLMSTYTILTEKRQVRIKKEILVR